MALSNYLNFLVKFYLTSNLEQIDSEIDFKVTVEDKVLFSDFKNLPFFKSFTKSHIDNINKNSGQIKEEFNKNKNVAYFYYGRAGYKKAVLGDDVICILSFDQVQIEKVYYFPSDTGYHNEILGPKVSNSNGKESDVKFCKDIEDFIYKFKLLDLNEVACYLHIFFKNPINYFKALPDIEVISTHIDKYTNPNLNYKYEKKDSLYIIESNKQLAGSYDLLNHLYYLYECGFGKADDRIFTVEYISNSLKLNNKLNIRGMCIDKSRNDFDYLAYLKQFKDIANISETHAYVSTQASEIGNMNDFFTKETYKFTKHEY